MFIEKSVDNKEIIKLIFNNREIYLGSKYNMTREIEDVKNKLEKINKKHQIILFGLGGGKIIKELEAYVDDRDILIIEPLNELKERLICLMANKKDNIQVLSLEEDDFKNKLKSFINKRFIQFVVFSNYDLIFSREIYNLKRDINEFMVDKTINENTRIVFSKNWFENYLDNLSEIIKSENLNYYKNVYNNKPAIIVSAGPSLEKNIHLLKGNEDKFIIITGIRTLATLKKEGIKCDFACVIDGSEEMYEVSKEALNEETPLFFSESANKKIIKKYKGKKIYFTSPNYRELNLKLGNFSTDLIYQGGSVAHSCLAISNYLGCNPIVFIGQDLAYTNNQIHSKNATIEGEQLVANNFDLYVEDINGNEVPTTYALDSFRKTFENFIESYNEITYINATEGGANIHGTQVKKLIEIIEKYQEKIDKSFINKYKENKIDKNILIKNIKENLNQILSLKKLAKEAILENDNLIKYYTQNNNKYKKSLNKLDYVDKMFNDNRKQFLLLNSLFYPIIKEIDIDFYDDKIDNFHSELDHIKFIAEKGKKLYENVVITIEFSISYINNAIKSLEEANCE